MSEPGDDEKYEGYLSMFNGYLEDFCGRLDCVPGVLKESIVYGLSSGGKRIRPTLLLASSDFVSLDKSVSMPYALALEMIHSYSLIHDDMPEMDDSAMRRGIPSVHAVFGAGNALLAGDALLNTAYSVLFEESAKGKNHAEAAKYLCDCAGIYGMIAGQSADMAFDGTEGSRDNLDFIYANKTGKLITAALAVPSILAGGRQFDGLVAFGERLGYLFQLTDDILDVEGDIETMGKEAGKDAENGKLTCVRMYGMDESRQMAADAYTDCMDTLKLLDGDTDFFSYTAKKTFDRIHGSVKSA